MFLNKKSFDIIKVNDSFQLISSSLNKYSARCTYYNLTTIFMYLCQYVHKYM